MSPEIFDAFLRGALLLFVLTLAATTVRIVRGPHLADRVVALDLLAYVSICITATGAMLTGAGTLLDVALVLSLLAFLGTIAFARFLERAQDEAES